jgi:RES domain
MAGNKPTRPIRLPPADFGTRKLPSTRQIARAWFRVHVITTKAISFNLKPTHRYSHPDSSFPILYVAMDPETCLWEVFGDAVFDHGHALPKTQWDDLMMSRIDVPHLLVCDLSKTTTRGALTVDLAALMNDDVSIPQAWGLAIQKHPANVLALKFKSRFTGGACLALFDCGGIRQQLRETPLGPISQSDAALNWLTKHQVTLV